MVKMVISIKENTAFSLESKNNIIVSDKRLPCCVDDLVVVETLVLLICKRSDTQKIKDLLGTVEDEYR